MVVTTCSTASSVVAQALRHFSLALALEKQNFSNWCASFVLPRVDAHQVEWEQLPLAAKRRGISVLPGRLHYCSLGITAPTSGRAPSIDRHSFDMNSYLRSSFFRRLPTSIAGVSPGKLPFGNAGTSVLISYWSSWVSDMYWTPSGVPILRQPQYGRFAANVLFMLNFPMRARRIGLPQAWDGIQLYQ